MNIWRSEARITHEDVVDAVIDMLEVVELFVDMWSDTDSTRDRRFLPVDLQNIFEIASNAFGVRITVSLTALPTSLKLATSSASTSCRLCSQVAHRCSNVRLLS